AARAWVPRPAAVTKMVAATTTRRAAPPRRRALPHRRPSVRAAPGAVRRSRLLASTTWTTTSRSERDSFHDQSHWCELRPGGALVLHGEFQWTLVGALDGRRSHEVPIGLKRDAGRQAARHRRERNGAERDPRRAGSRATSA